eukprot:TRINITY_DN56546_c0_g1_i1.p1 TRINITY_DN56546_c0_g1~~TRINITY_DN56546_c0_g1_i1.p1  ORF type:complete len:412 (-),score=69.57 TRINITY_DN56546_c0_g1_i1:554-1663(-)
MHAKPSRPRKRARASTRRKTVRWSTREVDALLAGVRTYGVGKWARILRHSPVFNGVRTSVDLKDKWRNLTSPVRAAALASESSTAPDPPGTPSVEPSQPLDSTSPVSASHPITPNLVDEPESAGPPASPPQSTRSPTPNVSLSEMPSVTPELLNTPPFAPPNYSQITPYTITQSLYHSAAALAADYWRRVSHDAVYGITPYHSMFPYMKQTQPQHSDDDDDDDEDDEAVQSPLYHPYNVALSQMLGRIGRPDLAHTLAHPPRGVPISTEPSVTETESYREDEPVPCIANGSDQHQHTDPKVSSSAMPLDVVLNNENYQAPAQDVGDIKIEVSTYDSEEKETSTSGDSDQSLLPNDPFFLPVQTLTNSMG